MKPVPAAFMILLGAMIFCGGCRKNPYDQKISAATQQELNQWLSLNTHRLSLEETAEIKDCLAEIKVSFMLAKEAAGQDNINRKMCEKIDGMALKDTVVLGYELQIARLELEKARLQKDLAYKRSLKARPGDLASANFLEDQKEQVRAQISKFDERLNRCNARIKELRKQFNMPEPADDYVPPVRINL